MSAKPRITLLFLVALLHLVAAVGVERTAATDQSTGDLHSHHDDGHYAVDPDRVRFLFSFQRQARPLNSLIRTLPVPWSENEAKPVTTPDHPAEALMRFRLASTMIVSRTLHLSLTVRELLYPFHYFL